MKTKSVIVLALVALSLAITGCNTISGAGKDISSAGRATTDAAEDARP